MVTYSLIVSKGMQVLCHRPVEVRGQFLSCYLGKVCSDSVLIAVYHVLYALDLCKTFLDEPDCNEIKGIGNVFACKLTHAGYCYPAVFNSQGRVGEEAFLETLDIIELTVLLNRYIPDYYRDELLYYAHQRKQHHDHGGPEDRVEKRDADASHRKVHERDFDESGDGVEDCREDRNSQNVYNQI